MAMNYTMQARFLKMRSADVTADDTAIDGSTSGYRLTDITKRDIIEYGPETNGIEIIFSAEGADNDTFGANIWNISCEGLALKVADLTCALGTSWADWTNTDNTSRLFADTATIDAEYHLKDVTVCDTGNNRIARIGLDTLGCRGSYVEFHSIGGVGQAKRLTPWYRFF